MLGFEIDEKKVLKNIKKNSYGQKYRLIKGFYKDTIKEKVSELGVGFYDVILDDTHQKHIISEYGLELITNSINDD